jgi:hypothetical protein
MGGGGGTAAGPSKEERLCPRGDAAALGGWASPYAFEAAATPQGLPRLKRCWDAPAWLWATLMDGRREAATDARAQGKGCCAQKRVGAEAHAASEAGARGS